MTINALNKYLLNTFYRPRMMNREKMVSKIDVGSVFMASSNIF